MAPTFRFKALAESGTGEEQSAPISEIPRAVGVGGGIAESQERGHPDSGVRLDAGLGPPKFLESCGSNPRADSQLSLNPVC